ncbi:hypothetical protein B7494_g5828 [Chlorociboria aeruginascens]|nr:hypothetical protein B7494_g5828 [Chlorociboria aeruginascens]
MSAFPPHRSIPSVPISQEIALKYLNIYLEATKSSPYLLPNARLEPSGPTAGSSNSSVVIHNLQRVEAGLRGEWLAPNLDSEENAGPVAGGFDDGTNTAADNMEVGGWQDLDEYQREQDVIEEGDAGIQETALGSEDDLDGAIENSGVRSVKASKLDKNPLRTRDILERDISTPEENSMDKAERKRRKRERLRREKMEKEAERKRKAAE